MRICTNADDFGEHEDSTRATIECLDKGALTGATIMPKMPATDLAVAYAKSRPDLSWGVHLTYVNNTVEAPVLDPATLPGLVNEKGLFLPSQKVRIMALFNKLNIDEIERETEAQIRSLIDKEVAIHHVDSHGHLHKFGPFRKALMRVLPRVGLTRVRGVQDIYLKKPLKSFTYWFGPLHKAKIKAAFDTTDYFYMPSSAWDMDWEQPLLDRLAKLDPNATIEVGVHPGYAEEWRKTEHAGILKFAQLAKAAGHTLIGWKDVPTRRL